MLKLQEIKSRVLKIQTFTGEDPWKSLLRLFVFFAYVELPRKCPAKN
jgi:hypothetical protein